MASIGEVLETTLQLWSGLGGAEIAALAVALAPALVLPSTWGRRAALLLVEAALLLGLLAMQVPAALAALGLLAWHLVLAVAGTVGLRRRTTALRARLDAAERRLARLEMVEERRAVAAARSLEPPAEAMLRDHGDRAVVPAEPAARRSAASKSRHR